MDMLMVRDTQTGDALEMGVEDVIAGAGRYRVIVLDADSGEMLEVSHPEMVAGRFRYAERFRPGSPSRAAAEQRAVALAGDDPSWGRPRSRRRRRTAP